MPYALIVAMSLLCCFFSPTSAMSKQCDPDLSPQCEPSPSIEYGARVFRKRCVLCHGGDGLGGGLLPLQSKNYPSTNLLKPKFNTDADSVRELIYWGGSRGKMSPLSPPWGDELTATQLDSVVLFIGLLRKQPKKGIDLIRQADKFSDTSIERGKAIYMSRCARCHGRSGVGDGVLKKMIKGPPPYDLTQSQASDKYLREIISKGGSAVNRSASMPPWGYDLMSTEIDSVIIFIKSFRDCEL
jgi:mono/diheme cytochrome c family protein